MGDYLPQDALVSINGMEVDVAASRIEALLDAALSPQQEAALAEARSLILNRYNPFAWAAYWAERLYQPGLPETPVTLRSHKAFRSFPRGHLFRLRNALNVV